MPVLATIIFLIYSSKLPMKHFWFKSHLQHNRIQSYLLFPLIFMSLTISTKSHGTYFLITGTATTPLSNSANQN